MLYTFRYTQANYHGFKQQELKLSPLRLSEEKERRRSAHHRMHTLVKPNWASTPRSRLPLPTTVLSNFSFFPLALNRPFYRRSSPLREQPWSVTFGFIFFQHREQADFCSGMGLSNTHDAPHKQHNTHQTKTAESCGSRRERRV